MGGRGSPRSGGGERGEEGNQSNKLRYLTQGLHNIGGKEKVWWTSFSFHLVRGVPVDIDAIPGGGNISINGKAGVEVKDIC